MRHNKQFIAFMTVATVAIIGMSAYLLFGNRTSPGLYRESNPTRGLESYVSKSPPPTVPDQTISLGSVTKTGTIGCLKHKANAGQTTMECAFGLLVDDGNSYALQSDDPALFDDTDASTKFRVTGTLSKTSSVYDVEGTIAVQHFEQL